MWRQHFGFQDSEQPVPVTPSYTSSCSAFSSNKHLGLKLDQQQIDALRETPAPAIAPRTLKFVFADHDYHLV